jgi:fermentation-respiration switch protein FrsA (DUF1100 family)
VTDADLAALSAAAYTAPAAWAAGDVAATLTGNVVAFRGTVPDCLADWLRDFDAVPVDDADLGWCHAGFRDGARAVFPAILAGTTGPLVLTGHSLGGALAVLTAALLRAAGQPVAELVTFGAPRAGGFRAQQLLDGVAIRQYRNAADPVPDVPWLPGLFTHMRRLTPIIGRGAPDPLDDHAISAYRAALA